MAEFQFMDMLAAGPPIETRILVMITAVATGDNFDFAIFSRVALEVTVLINLSGTIAIERFVLVESVEWGDAVTAIVANVSSIRTDCIGDVA